MDHRQISEFVNSKDVRKYLQDIGYEFSTPQAAWLVHRCQRLTMGDRHRAWREIIRDMPDCTMAERRNLKQIDSFHAFLMDYIKLEKRGVQEFMTAGNCIYRWQYHEIHIEDARYYKYWEDGDGFFQNYHDCINDYRQQMSEDMGISEVRVLKCGVSHSGRQMNRAEKLVLNSNLEILNVSLDYENDDEKNLAEAFDGMCFDFPSPFCRGDLLVPCTEYGSQGYRPFVLSHIATWNSEKMLSSGFGESDCPDARDWEHFDKVVEERLKTGDYTDGCTIETVANEYTGTLYRDHLIASSTDLEYFRGVLEGTQRQLKVLSCYEKGELDEAGLVNLCCAIRMEDIGRRCTWEYTDKFLKSIGMRPPK